MELVCDMLYNKIVLLENVIIPSKGWGKPIYKMNKVHHLFTEVFVHFRSKHVGKLARTGE